MIPSTSAIKSRLFTCFLVLLCILLDSCAKNPVTGKRQVMFMSEAQEIAMGKEADPQIVNYFGLYEDPTLQRFINEKGQQMAAISHRQGLNYEFKIVDSPIINAFAVPGGYVYFTRGIMAHFNNEAEFAGVLGHEIGHVSARHSASQQSKNILAQAGLIAGILVAPQFAQFAEAAQAGVGLLFLKHGRDAERESDRLGVEYSTKIGYDANEMAQFFETLERKEGDGGGAKAPGFLSTHPNPGDRKQTVTKLAAEWKKKLNLTDAQINRNNYLKMLDGLVYGEDPKQGFVEANVFYHPVLRFQFPVPANWAVQNSPQQVQMAPEAGNALLSLSLARGASLEEVARQILEQNKLTLMESKNTTVNGLTALAMIADQQQQQGTIRTLTYLIRYGDNIYNLMGISRDSDFNTLAPMFQSTMENFRELTDQAKINKQADRIRLITVGQAGTFEQVMRANNVEASRLQELSVLNGMNLDERVEQGMLLKVIGR
jgi:predicted Zn-dependent protease